MTQYLNEYLNRRKIIDSIQIGSLWVNTRLYTEYVFEVRNIYSAIKLIQIQYLGSSKLPVAYTYENFIHQIQKHLFVPYSR